MGDDLQQELAYYQALETAIEADQTIRKIPAIKEKLNLLIETVEDTKDNFIVSKDVDAKIGHKSEESSS